MIICDRDGLLADILTNPGDDVPRLIYADWLDEDGQPERAHYIRYSIRVPHCSFVELTKPGGDPFLLLGMEPGTPCLVGGGPQGQELRTWMWGETDSLGCVICDLGRGLNYRVDRGFVSGVLCKLSAWIEHGAALVRHHPVERVVISDRTPHPGDPDEPAGVYWYCHILHQGRPWPEPRDLPQELFAFLEDFSCREGWSNRFAFYPNDGCATVALSTACLAWARTQTG